MTTAYLGNLPMWSLVDEEKTLQMVKEARKYFTLQTGSLIYMVKLESTEKDF